jgi:hypothetical protein
MFLPDQEQLIRADMLRPQLVRCGVKMLGKVGDTPQRTGNGGWGIVAQLEVFEHPLA